MHSRRGSLKLAEGRALDEYKKARKQIDEHLSQIKKELEYHDRQAKDHPENWGYHGNLTHVLEQLVDIKNFLHSEY